MSSWSARGARWLRAMQAGQAIVWAAVMLPLFLAILGLAIDGGVVFDARRELQNVADGAARTGAMQLDEQTYRSTSGQAVVLDPGSAQLAAAAYISNQGSGMAATVTADTQRVVVTAIRSVPTSFIRIVGITNVQVSATATAEVQHGINQGAAG